MAEPITDEVMALLREEVVRSRRILAEISTTVSEYANGSLSAPAAMLEIEGSLDG